MIRQGNLFASFCTAAFGPANAALTAAGVSAMTESQQLLSLSPEPYPSFRVFRLDQDLGLETRLLVQLALRVPRVMDEWAQMLLQDTWAEGMGFRTGMQTPGRIRIPLLNYQSSNNPSDTGLTLRVELAGSRLWKSSSDGPDIRLHACHLNLFHS